MTTHVTYWFDPLCGWCYAASATIQRLSQEASLRLELAPTGLFADGGRVLDAAFANHAWSNDQRIAALTGLPFTEAYRQNVLGRIGSPFDSSVATLALTAVAASEPAREVELLRALQDARYVLGQDTCDGRVVAQVLRDCGLAVAADRLTNRDPALLTANAARIRKAQGQLHAHGVRGVPALLVSNEQGERVVRGEMLYGDVDRLLRAVIGA